MLTFARILVPVYVTESNTFLLCYVVPEAVRRLKNNKYYVRKVGVSFIFMCIY